jgi:hypothetical protein
MHCENNVETNNQNSPRRSSCCDELVAGGFGADAGAGAGGCTGDCICERLEDPNTSRPANPLEVPTDGEPSPPNPTNPLPVLLGATAGTTGADPNAAPPPKTFPPNAFPAFALLPPPNMSTRSSSGLEDVRTLLTPGVLATAAAIPEEATPSTAGASSKSSRFSACRPAATL